MAVICDYCETPINEIPRQVVVGARVTSHQTGLDVSAPNAQRPIEVTPLDLHEACLREWLPRVKSLKKEKT